MNQNEIGKRIKNSFKILAELISDRKSDIANIHKLNANPDITNEHNLKDMEVLADINIRISQYNSSIKGIINSIRNNPNNFYLEELCLYLEGCILEDFNDIMLMREDFVTPIKTFQKTLSAKNFKRMIENIINISNDSSAFDISRHLLVA